MFDKSLALCLRFVNYDLLVLMYMSQLMVWYTKCMTTLHLSRPHAIMMVGLPGSGKSFFAEQFAATFNAPYIDALTLTSYAKDVKSAMKIITNFAGQIVKTKQTFIYEGDTDSRALRAEFIQFVKSNGYTPLIIWVQVDEKSAKDRTLKAGKMDGNVFEDVAQSFQAPLADEKPVVISGKHTYASQAKKVLASLSREVRPAAAPQVTERSALQAPVRRPISVRS